MKERPWKKPKPQGPALRGEQVSELWVWIWSAAVERRAESPRHELDEARRLAVAYSRAATNNNNWTLRPGGRFQLDQTAVSTACLVHYLLTREEQWTAALEQPETADEARDRLRFIDRAIGFISELLGVDARGMRGSFERLQIGSAWQYSTVFKPEERFDVVIESLAEGPALPGDRRRRTEEATARGKAHWEALRNRPKKRRMLEGVTS